ncbi:MAG: PEP-CTERM sorting domain-containing protein, partial [Planctomycetia bacterium]|nr:PEP-CTERM sorting domain-containing protein [Planctomycetia bacterium]
SVTVLDHATPAFVGLDPALTNLVLDFGTVDQSAGLQSLGYSLTNVASIFGDSLTAGLALTGFAHDSGDTLFDTGLSTFANLLASGTNGYTASFTPSSAGIFSEVFRLSFSDNQSIAGAAQRRDLTVTMNVVVVPEPGALALAGIGVAVAAWGWSRRKSRA